MGIVRKRVTVRSCWPYPGVWFLSGLLSHAFFFFFINEQMYIAVISYWLFILYFICDDDHLGSLSRSLKVIILLTLSAIIITLSILLYILLVMFLFTFLITSLSQTHLLLLIWFPGSAWSSVCVTASTDGPDFISFKYTFCWRLY